MRLTALTSLGLILVAALLAAGLTGAEPTEDAAPYERVAAEESRGIDNLYRLGPRVLSGSQPEGDEGFETLRRLGVRTILSVDGGKTDPEGARRHGMRYVHLPIGYYGIKPDQAVRIVKAAEALPGPVFVHCHHGKHRGPTAAALICISRDGWSRERAEEWLNDAGTSPKYRGLYETVRRFKAPDAAKLEAAPAEFPEQVEVPSFVEAMVAVDANWRHLTAVRDAGWDVPEDHPDLSPPEEARLLWEHFRELERTDRAVTEGDQFLKLLLEAETAGRQLESALERIVEQRTEERRAAAVDAYDAVQKTCVDCHVKYRDS